MGPHMSPCRTRNTTEEEEVVARSVRTIMTKTDWGIIKTFFKKKKKKKEKMYLFRAPPSLLFLFDPFPPEHDMQFESLQIWHLPPSFLHLFREYGQDET